MVLRLLKVSLCADCRIAVTSVLDAQRELLKIDAGCGYRFRA